MRRLHRMITLALTMAGMAALSAAAYANDELPTLKQAAAKTGVLKHMTAATKLAGLDRGDVDVGPLTLLAPTDCAFITLDPDVRAKLLAPENVGLLTEVLLHHVLMGEYPMERFLNARVRNYTVDAIDGTEIEVYAGERGVDVDEGRIVRGDIMASDGIIHLIDTVLILPALMAEIEAMPMPGTTNKVSEGEGAENPEVAENAPPEETGSID